MEVNELDKDNGDKLTLARRVVIENVKPEIQCGRFPIKRTIGEPVEVTADIYADGHDIVHAVLLHRPLSQSGRSVESTSTASTFSPFQSRCGVSSNENGVYPPLYSPSRTPLTYTVAAVITPSKSTKTR